MSTLSTLKAIKIYMLPIIILVYNYYNFTLVNKTHNSNAIAKYHRLSVRT